MGKLSQSMFGRDELPKSAIVYAGSYVQKRKDAIRKLFSEWRKIKGSWIRYAYAFKDTSEYTVIFNVYGAALMLEVIQALKDGGTEKVFFIGSMGGKDTPIGTLVLPTSVFDAAGVVSVDSPRKRIVFPRKAEVQRVKEALRKDKEDYVSGKIASVPAVMHGIETVKRTIKNEKGILGVELEVSTFYHFTQKSNMRSYALLYVSDNEKHGILSGTKNSRQASHRALRKITKIAFEVLK